MSNYIDFPKNWRKIKVEDIALRIHYGYTASAIKKNTGIKILRITDIQDYKVNWDQVPFCEIDESDIEKFLLIENDILFTRTGATVGKSFLIEGNIPIAVFASYLIRIKLSKNINPKYLYYFFQSASYWKQIGNKSIGTGQPNINATSLSNIELLLCSYEEQKRIVEKIDESFDNLNNTVGDFKRLKKQLTIYREIILKQAYNGKLSQKWRLDNASLNADYLLNEIYNERLNRFNKEVENWKNLKTQSNSEFITISKPVFPKKFVSNPDLTLPDSWSQVAIGNICKKIENVNSKIQDSNRVFKYVDIGAISKFKIDRYKEYKWKYLPSRARQIIKLNDTLFSTVRTYLKNIAYVDKQDLDNEVGSTGFVILRPEKLIHPKFLFYYCISGTFINKLNKLQSGTSYPAIRDSDVLEQSFPVCSFEEQEQIVELIESQFSLIENLQQTIDENIGKADILRKSILKLAFEGKLITQNPDDTNIDDLILDIKNEKKIYLEELKKQVKLFPKKKNMKEKQKTILQILGSSKTSLSASELWKLSIFKDDIEAFYGELKKIQNKLQEEEKGILSLKK